MFLLFALVTINACFAGTMPATPENITVTFLTSTSVRVSWQTMIDLNSHPVEKYIVTYKPSDDRVVEDIAGNTEAVILDRLSPSTQYSMAVTAIWLGKKYRSRQIIFKTLDLPKPSQQEFWNNGLLTNQSGKMMNGTNFDEVTSTATNVLSAGAHSKVPTIRGVEIGIVLIVLMVWAGAIALFFNRWGKIRMLLPYQPDYKHEQLKVPGTGACSGGVCNGEHSHQHFHTLHEAYSASISERCSRSRINSAIFVSAEGIGFDSIEFLRRHGSQSILCRKAKSAENVGENEMEKQQFVNKSQQSIDENDELRSERIGNEKNFCEVELQEYVSNFKNTPARNRCGRASKKEDSEIQDSGFVVSNLAKVATDFAIGGVCIETPSSLHAQRRSLCSSRDDSQDEKQEERKKLVHPTLNQLKLASGSCDSSDTVEEFVVVEQKTKSEEHQSLLLPSEINRNRTLQISSNLKANMISRVSLPQRSSSSSSSPEENKEDCDCL